MNDATPLHTAARAAIARGWRVFPLRPRDKIPLIGKAQGGNGCKDATSHVGQIEAWWRGRPDCNIGLATGPDSGLWALDVDGDEGGVTLRALIAAHGLLPGTLVQSTGKGAHYLFRWPNGAKQVRNSARKLGPGLDVRGHHGYIVMAPSIHPSGSRYVWHSSPDDTPIANAPGWLLDLVIPEEKKATPAPAALKSRVHSPRDGRATFYGDRALDSACRRIAQAQPGTQNTRLTSEAASIGELVAGGELERAYAERALVAAGLAMACGGRPWLEPEIAGKVAWGLQVGAARPRRVTEERAPTPGRALRGATANAAPDDTAARLLIATPSPTATLIVAPLEIAEAAALAWDRANGGAFGLFATRDLATLCGGLAKNAGGYDDWRLPRADLARPALTMRWKGRVLIALPENLDAFTVSAGTKWERFISRERHTQVVGLLATHWWRHAGASDVQVAVLPAADEQAA